MHTEQTMFEPRAWTQDPGLLEPNNGHTYMTITKTNVCQHIHDRIDANVRREFVRRVSMSMTKPYFLCWTQMSQATRNGP